MEATSAEVARNLYDVISNVSVDFRITIESNDNNTNNATTTTTTTGTNLTRAKRLILPPCSDCRAKI